MPCNQSIKVMKKVSKKQRLVDYMLAAGNPGFTYTEVIKTLLKFRFGESFQYTSRYRGYYSCAISGINNYLMNNSGSFGLYKENGRYYAKYFTKWERISRAKRLFVRVIDYGTQYSSMYPWTRESVLVKAIDRATKNYLRMLKMIEKQTASQPSSY